MCVIIMSFALEKPPHTYSIQLSSEQKLSVGSIASAKTGVNLEVRLFQPRRGIMSVIKRLLNSSQTPEGSNKMRMSNENPILESHPVNII